MTRRTLYKLYTQYPDGTRDYRTFKTYDEAMLCVKRNIDYWRGWGAVSYLVRIKEHVYA